VPGACLGCMHYMDYGCGPNFCHGLSGPMLHLFSSEMMLASFGCVRFQIGDQLVHTLDTTLLLICSHS
jgi:hypothetical protein